MTVECLRGVIIADYEFNRTQRTQVYPGGPRGRSSALRSLSWLLVLLPSLPQIARRNQRNLKQRRLVLQRLIGNIYSLFVSLLSHRQLVADLQHQQLGSGLIVHLPYLKDIHYAIILCLIKGNAYQGIVNITFHLDNLRNDNSLDFGFNGSGIKYLKVNGRRLDPREVKYQQQKIQVPRELLKERSKNTVEFIF